MQIRLRVFLVTVFFVTTSYSFTNQIVARLENRVFTAYDVKTYTCIVHVLRSEKVKTLNFLNDYAYSSESLQRILDIYLIYQDTVKLKFAKKISRITLQKYIQEFNTKFVSQDLSDSFFKKLDLNDETIKKILTTLYTARGYILDIYRIDIFASLKDEEQKKLGEVYEGMHKKYSITYPVQSEPRV